MIRITASHLRPVAFAAGAAAVLFAMPAGAQESARATASYAAGAVAQVEVERAEGTAQRARSRPDERVLCIREQLTGSRMPRRICRTQQEWEALGAAVERR